MSSSDFSSLSSASSPEVVEAPMAEAEPTPTSPLVQVHQGLIKAMTPAEKMSSLNEQIGYFVKQTAKFPSWFIDTFEPAMMLHEQQFRDTSKSLERAYEFKKLSEAYMEMKHESMSHKAFEYLNKAINSIPSEEDNFFAICFAARSEVHLSRKDYASALLDIEAALHFRPHSYSCIRRKIDLLEDLKRPREAYLFLDDILRRSQSLKLASEKLFKLMAKKRYFQESGLTDAAKTTDEGKQVGNLTFDEKVCMKQNENHKRFGLFARQFIASGTILLKERPEIFVLKSDGRSFHCTNCWSECANTFWPCFQCSDVIYCSLKCSQENSTEHATECGLVSQLQSDSAQVHAIQVYRYLMKHGHEKLLDIDRKVFEYQLDTCFNSIVPSASVTVTQLAEWFAHIQSGLLHEYYRIKPARTATEIGSSIFILGLYLYRRGLPPSHLSIEQLSELVQILSTSLYAASINEYGWTDRSNGEKKPLAAFQCTFASRVGHSCEPNCEWFFSGKRFVLRTTKAVNADAELTIAFGVNANDTPNLYQRQNNLQRYLRMCACARCMTDATRYFCLACPHCSGPLPWSGQQGKQQVQCMVCEKGLTRTEQFDSLSSELQATQRAIWLLTTSANPDEYLPAIEKKMSTLASNVYLLNRTFLTMVRELCDVYLSRDDVVHAVAWYQWLAHENDIYLDMGNSELEDDSMTNKVDNLLVRFHFHDKWVAAYLDYLETAIEFLSHSVLYAHLTVCNRMITELRIIPASWLTLAPSSTLLDLGKDQAELGTMLTKLAEEKKDRYVALTRKAVNAHPLSEEKDLAVLALEPITNSQAIIDLALGPETLEIYAIGPDAEI